jgi:hypothetical protein
MGSSDTNDIQGVLGAFIGAADDWWFCEASHRTLGQRRPSCSPLRREEDVMRAPDHHFQNDHGLEAQPFSMPIALLLVVGSINVAATIFSLLAA